MAWVVGGGSAVSEPDEPAPNEFVYETHLAPPRPPPGKGYCLDLTEVTVKAYGGCVERGECDPQAMTQFWDGQDHGEGVCNFRLEGRDDHAMNCVDFYQATRFCHAQGKRLPSEVEWEWAARGGSQAYKYPWGNDEPQAQDACWSAVVRQHTTCPVASFPRGAAPGGFQDLAGNVWEWTSSSYALGEARRVIRGPSWDHSKHSALHMASRAGYAPENRMSDIGFRCAK